MSSCISGIGMNSRVSEMVRNRTLSENFTSEHKELKFQEIADKFDVTSMSEDEMIEMSSELYENGLISLGEHVILSFSRTGAINDIARITGSNNVSISGFSKTSSTEDSNYLKIWEKIQSEERRMGHASPEQQKLTASLVTLLKSL